MPHSPTPNGPSKAKRILRRRSGHDRPNMASEALRPNGVDFADAQFAPDGRAHRTRTRNPVHTQRPSQSERSYTPEYAPPSTYTSVRLNLTRLK